MSCDCKRCLQADKEIKQLEMSLEKVQAIAKSTLDSAPTRWKAGYEAGVKNANRDWESAVAYGKEQKKLRFDENATFTAEIMALEEKVLRMAPVVTAARCIRHWHDTCFNSATGETEGMVVSADHVRLLWDAIAEYDAESV